jgi:hypothetical protein
MPCPHTHTHGPCTHAHTHTHEPAHVHTQVTQLGHVKDLADAFYACVGNRNAERQVRGRAPALGATAAALRRCWPRVLGVPRPSTGASCARAQPPQSDSSRLALCIAHTQTHQAACTHTHTHTHTHTRPRPRPHTRRSSTSAASATARSTASRAHAPRRWARQSPSSCTSTPRTLTLARRRCARWFCAVSVLCVCVAVCRAPLACLRARARASRGMCAPCR